MKRYFTLLLLSILTICSLSAAQNTDKYKVQWDNARNEAYFVLDAATAPNPADIPSNGQINVMTWPHYNATMTVPQNAVSDATFYFRGLSKRSNTTDANHNDYWLFMASASTGNGICTQEEIKYDGVTQYIKSIEVDFHAGNTGALDVYVSASKYSIAGAEIPKGIYVGTLDVNNTSLDINAGPMSYIIIKNHGSTTSPSAIVNKFRIGLTDTPTDIDNNLHIENVNVTKRLYDVDWPSDLANAETAGTNNNPHNYYDLGRLHMNFDVTFTGNPPMQNGSYVPFDATIVIAINCPSKASTSTAQSAYEPHQYWQKDVTGEYAKLKVTFSPTSDLSETASWRRVSVTGFDGRLTSAQAGDKNVPHTGKYNTGLTFSTGIRQIGTSNITVYHYQPNPTFESKSSISGKEWTTNTAIPAKLTCTSNGLWGGYVRCVLYTKSGTTYTAVAHANYEDQNGQPKFIELGTGETASLSFTNWKTGAGPGGYGGTESTTTFNPIAGTKYYYRIQRTNARDAYQYVSPASGETVETSGTNSYFYVTAKSGVTDGKCSFALTKLQVNTLPEATLENNVMPTGQDFSGAAYWKPLSVKATFVNNSTDNKSVPFNGKMRCLVYEASQDATTGEFSQADSPDPIAVSDYITVYVPLSTSESSQPVTVTFDGIFYPKNQDGVNYAADFQPDPATAYCFRFVREQMSTSDLNDEEITFNGTHYYQFPTTNPYFFSTGQFVLTNPTPASDAENVQPTITNISADLTLQARETFTGNAVLNVLERSGLGNDTYRDGSTIEDCFYNDGWDPISLVTFTYNADGATDADKYTTMNMTFPVFDNVLQSQHVYTWGVTPISVEQEAKEWGSPMVNTDQFLTGNYMSLAITDVTPWDDGSADHHTGGWVNYHNPLLVTAHVVNNGDADYTGPLACYLSPGLNFNEVLSNIYVQQNDFTLPKKEGNVTDENPTPNETEVVFDFSSVFPGPGDAANPTPTISYTFPEAVTTPCGGEIAATSTEVWRGYMEPAMQYNTTFKYAPYEPDQYEIVNGPWIAKAEEDTDPEVLLDLVLFNMTYGSGPMSGRKYTGSTLRLNFYITNNTTEDKTLDLTATVYQGNNSYPYVTQEEIIPAGETKNISYKQLRIGDTQATNWPTIGTAATIKLTSGLTGDYATLYEGPITICSQDPAFSVISSSLDNATDVNPNQVVIRDDVKCTVGPYIGTFHCYIFETQPTSDKPSQAEIDKAFADEIYYGEIAQNETKTMTFNFSSLSYPFQPNTTYWYALGRTNASGAISGTYPGGVKTFKTGAATGTQSNMPAKVPFMAQASQPSGNNATSSSRGAGEYLKSFVFYTDMEVNGTLTGIEQIVAEGDDSTEVYNLAGVRMNPANLASGIYIVRKNGVARKVVIR